VKAVCLLSGGMDSSTLAYYARDQGYRVLALHLNYGQKTEEKERSSARTIARLVGVDEFLEIDLSYFKLFGKSSLTDRTIPVEPYSPTAVDIPNTYVPFRNANLLSHSDELRRVTRRGRDLHRGPVPGLQRLPGLQAGFHRGVPEGDRDRSRRGDLIRLVTPFVTMSKREILALGLSLGVPYEHTWSCYQAEDVACGVCGACHFRRAAFDALGVEDPIPYRREA